MHPRFLRPLSGHCGEYQDNGISSQWEVKQTGQGQGARERKVTIEGLEEETTTGRIRNENRKPENVKSKFLLLQVWVVNQRTTISSNLSNLHSSTSPFADQRGLQE